jgi:hypothetical protein
MEKEFVPYELALRIKELGFNEKCFGYYTKYKEFFYFDVDDLSSAYTKNMDNLVVNSVDELECTAPTFSQCFRWFREKYNIQGYIYSSTVRGNSEKTKQFTGYIWNINGIDMPFISTDARDELHDTYEEAEVACLNKLIKIVKTK